MSPDLIQLAKRGDEQAFSTIVGKIAYDDKGNDKLQRYAKKNNYLDTDEDLLQEFKLKIWVAILKYDRKNKIDIEIFAWNLIRNWMIDKQRKYFDRREKIIYNSNSDNYGDFAMVHGYVRGRSDNTLNVDGYEKLKLIDDRCKEFDDVEFSMIMQKLQGVKWQIANMLCLGFTKTQVQKRLKINKRRFYIELKKIKKSFGICLN
jgi:hypothetical protein